MSDKKIIDLAEDIDDTPTEKKHKVRDEIDVDGSLLNELVNNNKDAKDREIEKAAAKVTKKKRFGRKKKKSKKNDKGFIDVEDDSSASNNFVIVSQDDNKIKTSARITGKIIAYTALAATVITLVALALLFRVTGLNVQGSNELFNTGLYTVPSSYVANTGALQSGDTIIVSDQNDLIPYLLNYTAYRYKKRSGQLLQVTDERNKEHIISAGDVTYIIQK